MAPDRDQPARAIRGYPRSLARSPKLPFVPLVAGGRDGFDLARVTEPCAAIELDLTRLRPTAPRARSSQASRRE